MLHHGCWVREPLRLPSCCTQRHRTGNLILALLQNFLLKAPILRGASESYPVGCKGSSQLRAPFKGEAGNRKVHTQVLPSLESISFNKRFKVADARS